MLTEGDFVLRSLPKVNRKKRKSSLTEQGPILLFEQKHLTTPRKGSDISSSRIRQRIRDENLSGDLKVTRNMAYDKFDVVLKPAKSQLSANRALPYFYFN